MSIRIGDINIGNEIVELHYQVTRTQLLLDYLLSKNPSILKPDASEMVTIDNKAMEIIQKKFPNMGIKKKE